jgi:hypothetical protein
MTIFRDKIALTILSAGLLIRAFAGAIIPPGFDEAYYGVYALHPAWGYFDHPPLVALTAGIGRNLTGSFSVLSLRLGAILLFLFTAGLIYTIARELYGVKAGRISLSLAHIIPYFFLGMGAFVIPDNALGVFWLLFLYSLLKIQRSGNAKWFILSGLSLGFGMLAKYHTVLLLLGLLWCLIFYPEWRRFWKSPYPYISWGIALIIFSPNMCWNYQHNWISYAFQFGKSASGHNIDFGLFLQGIGLQAGYLLPWNLIILVLVIIRGFKKGNSGTIRWLLPFAIIPIVIFTLVGGTRQILPHWPMPGYLVGMILAGGVLTRWRAKTLNRYFIFSGAIILLLTTVIILQSLTGFLPLNKKADLTLDGLGWREMIIQLREEGNLPEDAFLFAHKWFNGGELAYATQGEFPVTVFNLKSPQGFAFWVDNCDLVGKDGIFVCTDRYPAEAVKLYQDYFIRIIPLEDISIERGGKIAQVFHVWCCENLLRPFPAPY